MELTCDPTNGRTNTPAQFAREFNFPPRAFGRLPSRILSLAGFCEQFAEGTFPL